MLFRAYLSRLFTATVALDAKKKPETTHYHEGEAARLRHGVRITYVEGKATNGEASKVATTLDAQCRLQRHVAIA